MTPQELFNTICSAVIEQGKPAIYPTLTQHHSDGSAKTVFCLYRAPDGSKCAAGHVIPDDRYDPSFENKPISMISNKALPKEINDTPDLYIIIYQLQVAHDDAARESLHLYEPKDFITQFKTYAFNVAADMNLDATVVS